MSNPWETIPLNDYENHMKLDSVCQLQAMNEMMYNQFYRYPISTLMILGIAGGNGLNHISTDKIKKVYGVDINPNYLEECVKRYPHLKHIFYPIQANLLDTTITLPKVDMVIANLLIEYIGYDNFLNSIQKIKPSYISCIIQINDTSDFVSESPYIHTFDCLEGIHCDINEDKLKNFLQMNYYKFIFKLEKQLPNGKKLIQLDYQKIHII